MPLRSATTFTVHLPTLAPRPGVRCATLLAVLVMLLAAVLLAPAARAELSPAIDAAAHADMAERHMPGLVVVVVRDGEVIHSRGYGFADLQQQRPMDPQTTGLCVGSLTKIFTATAVLQLWDQGRLSLDDHVQPLVPELPLNRTRKEPITFRHLLTHSAGFDRRYLGTFSPPSAELPSLAQFLITAMPQRIHAPGRYALYSDYGYALLGHLVERITGESYADYVQQHILDPLGMTATGLDRAAAERVTPATGYRWTGGRLKTIPAGSRPHGGPAGGLVSTGHDMARFMLAVLNGGELDGQRIFGERTMAAMGEVQFAHREELAGWTFGWHATTEQGQYALEYVGRMPGFCSRYVLVPELKLGIFVSGNGESGNHRGIIDALLAELCPPPVVTETPAPPADFAARAHLFTGRYWPWYVPQSSVEKLAGLFTQITVSDPGDGTLLVAGIDGRSHFVEVAPLLFRQVGGERLIAFEQDGRGRIVTLFKDTRALPRAWWHETPLAQVGVCAGVVAICVAWWAAWWWRVWRTREQGRTTSRTARLARIGAALASLLALVFLGSFVIILGVMDQADFVYGFPWMCQVVLSIPAALAVVVALLAVAVARVWWQGELGMVERCQLLSVGVGTLVLLMVLHGWHVLL